MGDSAGRRPVLLFDVFRTLLAFDGDHVDENTYDHLAGWLRYRGVDVGGDALRSAVADVQAIQLAAAQSPTPDVDTLDVWTSVLSDLGVQRQRAGALAPEIALVYRQVTTRSIEVWPGTFEMLDACRGFRLGIVSNTQRAYTETELRMLGLWGYFEIVVFSSDVLACKPDPVLFDTALAELGVEPSDVLYVGDNPHDDVLGASRAGIRTILLDRGTPVAEGAVLATPLAAVRDGDPGEVARIARQHFGVADQRDGDAGTAELGRRVLSAEDVRVQLQNRIDGEMLDFRGVEIRGGVFGVRDRITMLEQVDFSGATLIECAFTNVFLRDVRFQEAVLEGCDLRYAETERSSFKRARLTGCDLYRARLGSGTVLEGATICNTSLNLTTFDGVSLPRDAMSGASYGLLQEDAAEFERFHRIPTALKQAQSDPWIDVHLARRHQEASDIYRALSAHWSSSGRTRDAGWAYYHGRRLEVHASRPDRVLHRRRAEARISADEVKAPDVLHGTVRWGLGSLARWVAGFGESPFRVAVSTLSVVVICAAVFGFFGPAADVSTGPWSAVADSLLFSSQAMTASLDLPVDAPRWVRWASEIETALGITLLGLLGFCLGNRLRSA